MLESGVVLRQGALVVWLRHPAHAWLHFWCAIQLGISPKEHKTNNNISGYHRARHQGISSGGNLCCDWHGLPHHQLSHQQDVNLASTFVSSNDKEHKTNNRDIWIPQS
jgi:hypothetical protein